MHKSCIKEQLHYYIDYGDEGLLDMMWEMVNSYKLNASTAAIQQYNKDIDESLQQVRDGDFVSQQELEEQSEKW